MILFSFYFSRNDKKKRRRTVEQVPLAIELVLLEDPLFVVERVVFCASAKKKGGERC